MIENPEEKRRHPRFNFRIPMRYRKTKTSTREFKGCLMKNISAGGVRMGIYEFLPRNLRLALEIPLVSGTKPVKGTCRVAWVAKAAFSEQYDVGLGFVHLSQGDTKQIAKFVFLGTVVTSEAKSAPGR